MTTFNASSTTNDVIAGISLADRVAVVTGTSAGLGIETARVLAAAGALAVAGIAGRPDPASAQSAGEFAAALKKATGDAQPQAGKIAIGAPEIAENGAVVPVGVTSSLPKTEMIAILVEKNPNMLVANFTIPSGTEAAVTTRAKMGQTSNVVALVKADGKFYYAVKEVKVTLGGCGG